MIMNRREFLRILAAASAAGLPLGSLASGHAGSNSGLYDLPRYGNVSLLHYTDCHGQLNPIFFREPNINIGVAAMRNQPPHLVGHALLEHFGITPDTNLSHAFTYLNFVEAAERYGRVGGFAHLSTLVKQMRATRPGALLLDGGDTWGGGTGTGVWTNAQDMVDAQKLLGVDIMTGHWEFTYGAERVKEIVDNDFASAGIEFVAQNVTDVDWGDQVFKPYVIREINGVNVAIIGQAFPYTPIANPRFKVAEWTFGIRPDDMQNQINAARAEGAEIVVALSHNGMDVDLKLATMVEGLDAIFGGHTHDGIPAPTRVTRPDGGICLVTNAGSNAKFLGVMDFDFRDGKIQGWKYHLLPVFSNLIEPDQEMQTYIDTMRNQVVTFDGQTFNMQERLSEELAVAESLLFRRGNFNGTFDQLICDALMEQLDAEVAFSPGFRWGTTVLPGMPITFEHVMDQTGLTYPAATRNVMSGEQIKTILEDVADNLFHEDPFFQQGGDMVRIGGLRYTIDPTQTIGNRLHDLEIGGQPLDADRDYVVAGWASVQEQPAGDTGRKIWDVVADYLRDQKTIRIDHLNEPVVKGIGEDNLGFVPTDKT